MGTKKPFDCIAMKDEIQARLAKSWCGLTDEEIRDRVKEELRTSKASLVQWWRGTKTAEDPTGPLERSRT
ncbi:MAG TPA: hypothetical protein HPP77_05735 [Candidatus Hydrogenedentes bacterium]|nr:hypothetical protein [Candidatus Hydrogenedentota bacterium]HIJ72672.1 hypothetical protein [Candidatus Hydrogenedentota bacterium]